MDFLLTDPQRAFRAKLRAWIGLHLPLAWDQGRFADSPSDEERGGRLRAWERKVYNAGFAGLHWPKAYGGHGLTLVEHFLWGEETGRVGAPEGINPIGRELVAGVLLHAGSEPQKLHLLPRIAACTDVWCQGFSEPNAGSDLTSLKTRATLQGDVWHINGQKIWTSYGQHADMCLLLARTSKESKKAQGLTMFAVPMISKGITRRGMRQLDGSWDFNEVFFDDVTLPLDSTIGPVGEGWAVSNAVLAIERATTRLYRQARFLNELQHADRIRREGDPDCKNSDYAQQLVADSYAQLIVLRAMNIKFVGRIVAGEKVGSEASLLKECWSHFHQQATSTIAELLGEAHWCPSGQERAADRFLPVYMHSRAETIFAGTSEIQRTIIAERLLEMPRTP